MKRLQWSFFIVICLSLLLGGPAAAADKGAKAEVWLESRTRFSGFSLPPGQYLFQHTMDGAGHIMIFVQLRAGSSSVLPKTYKLMPVRVRCKLEPLQGKASRTALYYVSQGGANRATRLEIQRENVAHVF